MRIVNTILDSIDLSSLEKTYLGGGTASYHPKVLLKVLVDVYLRNVYSSRKIEQALNENIHFIWLGSGAKPDHNTISNFRVERNHEQIRLKAKAKELLLSEEGIVRRKRRCWDVEAVFGNIKHNMGFKRFFMLRGLDKVTAETGLVAGSQP
ncbi:transposase [Zhouia spongiae]|uniref:Transposase n=1 Tax=Zhouia spongiae TaxID=2202721 RepID=A0ABY3YHZ5_9FLAO|nr:transposase [Zhouia spongiae]UNY97325.1 transposase [Zhouia spongiae]